MVVAKDTHKQIQNTIYIAKWLSSPDTVCVVQCVSLA